MWEFIGEESFEVLGWDGLGWCEGKERKGKGVGDKFFFLFDIFGS